MLVWVKIAFIYSCQFLWRLWTDFEQIDDLALSVFEHRYREIAASMYVSMWPVWTTLKKITFRVKPKLDSSRLSWSNAAQYIVIYRQLLCCFQVPKLLFVHNTTYVLLKSILYRSHVSVYLPSGENTGLHFNKLPPPRAATHTALLCSSI